MSLVAFGRHLDGSVQVKRLQTAFIGGIPRRLRNSSRVHGPCRKGGAHIAANRQPPRSIMSASAAASIALDPHAQLRRLYLTLLQDQNRFDEFKQLLALYPSRVEDVEPDEARGVRIKLNARITAWLDGGFDGLSAAQVSLWRSIVVEERINVTLSPWKESNLY